VPPRRSDGEEIAAPLGFGEAVPLGLSQSTSDPSEGQDQLRANLSPLSIPSIEFTDPVIPSHTRPPIDDAQLQLLTDQRERGPSTTQSPVPREPPRAAKPRLSQSDPGSVFDGRKGEAYKLGSSQGLSRPEQGVFDMSGELEEGVGDSAGGGGGSSWAHA